MKYRLESTTLEAIDTYVRITIGSPNGDKIRVTDKETPHYMDVVSMLASMQGYSPNRAQIIACGRAAADARNNKIELFL